jgi:hypothetical protein
LFHFLVFLEGDERARARFLVDRDVPGREAREHAQGHRYLPANSTERICSTFEPRLAISSISSKLMLFRRRASATMRGSVV